MTSARAMASIQKAEVVIQRLSIRQGSDPRAVRQWKDLRLISASKGWRPCQEKDGGGEEKRQEREWRKEDDGRRDGGKVGVPWTVIIRKTRLYYCSQTGEGLRRRGRKGGDVQMLPPRHEQVTGAPEIHLLSRDGWWWWWCPCWSPHTRQPWFYVVQRRGGKQDYTGWSILAILSWHL